MTAQNTDLELLLGRMSDREREIDPQLPVRSLNPGDAVVRRAGSGNTDHALAVSREKVLTASDPEAIWGPLVTSSLELRWDGDEPAAARLLREWVADTAPRLGEDGDWETSLSVKVPSRDSGLVRPLLSQGFACVDITGIRVGARGVAEPEAEARLRAGGVTLRLATSADAPLLGVLDSELLAHDAQHGGLADRPGAAAILQVGIEVRLAIDPEWTWVIEQRGEAVGYLSIELNRERHLQACAQGGGVAFIQAMYLRPTVRGGGIGEAVVEFAHARIEAEGFDRILLGYAAQNPRSGPFWCRMGYRPLWSGWQRRPGLPAGTTVTR